MSVLRPVGPHPARVYWVRRGLVAVGLVLLLLAASWAWGAVSGGDDGSGAPTAAPASPTPTDSAAPSTSSSPSSSPSVSASDPPNASPSATSGDPQPCPDKSITVLATTSQSTYPNGTDPRFTIKVVNDSKKTCTRDVGQKAMEVRVSKGERLIWSSDHCAPGGSAKIVTLKSGASFTTSVVWTRIESEKGCPDNPPSAEPGTYALTGRDLAVTSEPTAFALD